MLRRKCLSKTAALLTDSSTLKSWCWCCYCWGAALCHVSGRSLPLPHHTHTHTHTPYTPQQVLQQLDRQETATLALETALRGVFAGNIFDLGAAASAERYESGQGAGFHCALDQLLPRPWVSNVVSLLVAATPSMPLVRLLLLHIPLVRSSWWHMQGQGSRRGACVGDTHVRANAQVT